MQWVYTYQFVVWVYHTNWHMYTHHIFSFCHGDEHVFQFISRDLWWWCVWKVIIIYYFIILLYFSPVQHGTLCRCLNSLVLEFSITHLIYLFFNRYLDGNQQCMGSWSYTVNNINSQNVLDHNNILKRPDIVKTYNGVEFRH